MHEQGIILFDNLQWLYNRFVYSIMLSQIIHLTVLNAKKNVHGKRLVQDQRATYHYLQIISDISFMHCLVSIKFKCRSFVRQI